MNVEELKQRYADGDRDFSITDLKGTVLEGINLSSAVLPRAMFDSSKLRRVIPT
jgi:uncharacterized protein YjbI with pentapeptide repeats